MESESTLENGNGLNELIEKLEVHFNEQRDLITELNKQIVGLNEQVERLQKDKQYLQEVVGLAQEKLISLSKSVNQSNSISSLE